MKRTILALLFLLPSTYATAESYFVGPWVWSETCPISETGCWTPPTGCQQGFDFRPANDNTMAGEALFVCSNDVAGYKELTNQQAFELLEKKFVTESDPAGVTGPKPLMPAPDGKIRFQVGELQKEEAVDFESEYGQKVKDVLAEDARKLPADTAGKFVEVQRRQFGFNPAPEIEPKDPHTTITDDWNCTDSASINCDLTWTEVVGDFSIVSNAASLQSFGVNAGARAESALSSANHYVQFAVTTGGISQSFALGLVRFSASAQTYYYGLHGVVSGDNVYLGKYVAGTPTALSFTSVAFSEGETMKMDITGSTLTIYKNGVSMRTTTDTDITGNLYTGVGGNKTLIGFSVVLDNFEASDGISSGSRRLLSLVDDE